MHYIELIIKHLEVTNCIKLRPVNSEEKKYIQFDKCNSKVSDGSKIVKLCFDEEFKEFTSLLPNFPKSESESLSNENLIILKVILYNVYEKISKTIGLCTDGFKQYLPTCIRFLDSIPGIDALSNIRAVCKNNDPKSAWFDATFRFF